MTNGIISPNFTMVKDNIFKENLTSKKIRLQRFYINNTKVAIYLPNRMTSQSQFNASTNAGTTSTINGTLGATSLDYYIVLRQQSNANACIVYLQQPNINAVPTNQIPQYPITDDYTYYTNPYFQYYDFTHFLTIIINAFYSAQTLIEGDPPLTTYLFWMNTDNTFTFLAPNDTYTNYYFEFSPSLINLFPFKNMLTSDGTYRLIFNTSTVTVSSSLYNMVSCPFYDTIYPFMQLLWTSDNINIQPITFVNNQSLQTNLKQSQFNSSILTYDIGTELFNQTYNYYSYVNNFESIFANFAVDTSNLENITINLYLRMRNNLLIPYPLAPGEMFTFSMEIVRYGKAEK